jgi:hypothetical protein
MLNAPLSGLDKLQAQAQEHMAAPAHIPLIKLFGVTPTGLGATGEGEIQVWYDWVAAQQAHALGDHVNRMLEIVQMDLYGAVDDDISYKWVPLFQPTPKEQSDLNKTEADRDAAYITNSVVTPDEVRKKLIADPNSGYNGLTGDAPEPEQDAGLDEDGNPIEAPAQPDPDGDANREHESSEADKDRAHEAEQNDADRKNALKLAAKKKIAKDEAFNGVLVALDAFNETQHPRDNGGQFTESGAGNGSNKPMKTRKYPSMTTAELEKAVAEGRGNPVMVQEIADRKSGASQIRVTPQILGGKVQVKLGRM